ncbi:MAG: type IVB secretion system protein IcmV [Legionellaceae bacterium]|nr:type IVB secretion system protein IcmV [Legionellaceae bacterium]
MSEKPGSRLALLFARVFHFRLWLDVDRLKGFTQYLTGLLKKVFIPQPQKAEESFNDAKARLQLTDEQLLKRQQALLRTSILMLVLAGLLFFYGFYQLLYGGTLGVLLTLVVILIALTMAFRYHFWHFQIKEKKLGCSWKIWLNEGLLGGKKS